MARKQGKNGDDYKMCVIQSKVSAHTDRRLNAVVKKYGFESRYELLQYIISAFLHYADPKSEKENNESADLDMIGTIFKGFDNPAARLNTSRLDGADMELTDVIRLMKGGDAYSCVWTHSDAKGTTECSSAPAVLELILMRLLPDRYAYLRQVADEIDSVSVLRALDYLIEADKRCGTPSGADYASNEYGVVPVRKQYKPMDK